MNYLSHQEKKLKNHIENIANFKPDDRAFQMASKFHDLGKVKDEFQIYIQGKSKTKTTHSNISALIYLFNHIDNFKPTKENLFIFLSILSHHGRLKSLDFEPIKLDEKELKAIYSKSDVVEFFGLREIEPNIPRVRRNTRELEFDIRDFIAQKELFSSLIFADKFEAIFSQTPKIEPLEIDLDSLQNYLNSKKDTIRSKVREEILNRYKTNSNESIYQITAPTGIGKTLISLNLAIEITKDKNLQKIIYAIPFTTIIDQTCEVFESIFKNRITKIHHLVDYKDEDENNDDYSRWKFLLNSFSDNFIVTTFYQLFFAIFSNQNIDNIKFQALKNSVIILDETQAIPFILWKPLQEILPILAKELNITFILMSATMPIIAKDSFELTDKKNLFTQKNRYRLKYLQDDLIEAIKSEANSDKSILVIVNTIEKSKRLYHELSSEFENIYCLNSYILPKDRIKILNELREDGSNRVKNKILISTQLIEAGVDLDFDIGFREFAPISSIIQSAGRINREGAREISTLFIFDSDCNIYDSIFMSESKKFLIDNHLIKRDLEECEILALIEEFFDSIDSKISDRCDILGSIKKFDFDSINRANQKAFDFEDSYLESVVLGVDLKKIGDEFLAKIENKNRFEIKEIREQLFKSLNGNILNIKKKDLCDGFEVKNLKNEFDIKKTLNITYYENLHNVYSPKSGFLLDFEKDLNDSCFI